jgi:hypothetical protein
MNLITVQRLSSPCEFLSLTSKYSAACNYNNFCTDIRANCGRRLVLRVTATYYLRCVTSWRYVSIIRGADKLRITENEEEKQVLIL